MDEKQSIARRPEVVMPQVSADSVAEVSRSLALFQEKVAALLVPVRDYGKIPGVEGQGLFDSGANLVMGAFEVFPGQRRMVNLEVREGLISVIMEVPLIHRETGKEVASGIGAASTLETKHKYRWVDNPEDWGYGEESQQRLQTRERWGKQQYRIRNPEPDDLINTLVKMASKRAEVDAALSLPGVPSALKDLGDRDQWHTFWGECTRMGLTEEEVHQALGVKSVKHYLAAGHTQQDAIIFLRKWVQQRGRGTPPPVKKTPPAAAGEASRPAPPETPLQPPAAEAGQPSDDELFPSDPREVVRQYIVHLLTKGPVPTARQLEAWWEGKGWGYQLRPEDMAKPFSGSEVLLSHLEAFRDDLLAYQSRAARSKQGSASAPSGL